MWLSFFSWRILVSRMWSMCPSTCFRRLSHPVRLHDGFHWIPAHVPGTGVWPVGTTGYRVHLEESLSSLRRFVFCDKIISFIRGWLSDAAASVRSWVCMSTCSAANPTGTSSWDQLEPCIEWVRTWEKRLKSPRRKLAVHAELQRKRSGSKHPRNPPCSLCRHRVGHVRCFLGDICLLQHVKRLGRLLHRCFVCEGCSLAYLRQQLEYRQ